MKAAICSIMVGCLAAFTTARAGVHVLDHPVQDHFYYVDDSGEVRFCSAYDLPFSDGLAAVSNTIGPWNRTGFLDTTGRMAITVDGTRAENFSEGLAAFAGRNGKWGYLDRAGQVAIEPQFSSARPFRNGFARVARNGRYGFIDRKGRAAVECKYYRAEDFSEGLAAVANERKAYPGAACYGFIDTAGRALGDISYLEVSRFNQGFAWASVPAKSVTDGFALLGADGKPVTPFKYTCRHIPPPPPDFVNGLLWAEVRVGEYGYDRVALNRKGEEVARLSGLRNLLHQPGAPSLAQCDEDGLYYYVDERGRDVFRRRFFQASEFREGRAIVRETQDGPGYFIDGAGKRCPTPQADDLGFFSEGLAPAFKNGKWGFIDTLGRLAIGFAYDRVGAFSEGMARVQSGGKWGYIGRDGAILVKPQFEAAGDYKDGVARVGSRAADSTSDTWEYWRYLGRDGRVLWEPSNEIPENCAVALPPGYDAAKRHPVLVFLPYTGGEADRLASEYFGDIRGEGKRGGWTGGGYVLLIAPGRGSEADHGWQGFTRAIERYERRIMADLDSLCRSPGVDTSRIFLAGFSLGGDLCWALLNRDPGRFRGAVIMGSRCGYSHKGSLPRLAARKARVYLAVGQNEERVRSAGAERALSALEENGIPSRLHVIPRGGHCCLGREQFLEALEFVDQ